jgi:hypothetical protein
MVMLAEEKCSCLFSLFVSAKEKSFVTLATGAIVKKNFLHHCEALEK